ncbi:hypothetical protein [Alteripontixanthobacter maritimus]|nr:hypothetical protein [Alteripontixanthobacter maritimus]
MAEPENPGTLHDYLEFLLSVLVALDRRIVPIEEAVEDLFHNWHQARFYCAWLDGLGLTVPSHSADIFGSRLPTEAQAIIVMLASTRTREDVPLSIGLPTLRHRSGLEPASDAEEREEVIAQLEAFADTLDYRFERARIGTKDAITLVGKDVGPNMPLRRVLWTITFTDAYAQDRFYLWLLARIDRWQTWGELAHRKGGRALSEHLLRLKFANEKIDLSAD